MREFLRFGVVLFVGAVFYYLVTTFGAAIGFAASPF